MVRFSGRRESDMTERLNCIAAGPRPGPRLRPRPPHLLLPMASGSVPGPAHGPRHLWHEAPGLGQAPPPSPGPAHGPLASTYGVRPGPRRAVPAWSPAAMAGSGRPARQVPVLRFLRRYVLSWPRAALGRRVLAGARCLSPPSCPCGPRGLAGERDIRRPPALAGNPGARRRSGSKPGPLRPAEAPGFGDAAPGGWGDSGRGLPSRAFQRDRPQSG